MKILLQIKSQTSELLLFLHRLIYFPGTRVTAHQSPKNPTPGEILLLKLEIQISLFNKGQ